VDRELFRARFADLLAPYRDRVAVVMFEFGTFSRSVFPTPGDFLTRLSPFLKSLPGGLRYGVEIRNPEYLTPEYCAALKERNVAHVYNAWTRMPALGDQAAIPETVTADFTAGRALLSRGRSYEQAVKLFQPYQSVREPNDAAREGLVRIARGAMDRQKPAFLTVNNRLEGHAPTTIEAVADRLL
jgi:hypothetical protein